MCELYFLNLKDFISPFQPPVGIYLLKGNNKNTRTRCEIFKINNKDTRTTPGVALVSLLLTLNIFHTLFQCFIVNFEKVNADRALQNIGFKFLATIINLLRATGLFLYSLKTSKFLFSMFSRGIEISGMKLVKIRVFVQVTLTLLRATIGLVS